MFPYAAVHVAIDPAQAPAGARDIHLAELDGRARLGVGRGGEGSFVLVAPGQPRASLLVGKHFGFDPWTDLVDYASGATLKDVCVLRLLPEAASEPSVRDAVAAVFTGLLEMASTSTHALGEAIVAMQGLFESSLKSRTDRNTEAGLAGELLLIAEASNPQLLADTWRTQVDRPFDFSMQGERLDVKTTIGIERVHWFSSGQVTPIPGVCSSFVSIALPVVEIGSTVASTFSGLTALTVTQLSRVRSVIIGTTGEPPEVLTSVVFDRVAARASMLHLASSEVPAPVPGPGVRRMRWEAEVSTASRGPFNGCGFSPALGL